MKSLSMMMSLKSALFLFHQLMHRCIPFKAPKKCMLTLKEQSTRRSQQSKNSREREWAEKASKDIQQVFENGLMEMPLLHFQNWFLVFNLLMQPSKFDHFAFLCHCYEPIFTVLSLQQIFQSSKRLSQLFTRICLHHQRRH